MKLIVAAGALSAVVGTVGFGILGALGAEVSAGWAALGFFTSACYMLPEAFRQFS